MKLKYIQSSHETTLITIITTSITNSIKYLKLLILRKFQSERNRQRVAPSKYGSSYSAQVQRDIKLHFL